MGKKLILKHSTLLVSEKWINKWELKLSLCTSWHAAVRGIGSPPAMVPLSVFSFLDGDSDTGGGEDGRLKALASSPPTSSLDSMPSVITTPSTMPLSVSTFLIGGGEEGRLKDWFSSPFPSWGAVTLMIGSSDVSCSFVCSSYTWNRHFMTIKKHMQAKMDKESKTFSEWQTMPSYCNF